MKEVRLKVMEALQEEAYKGIVRIDSDSMKNISVRPGDIIEIEGERKTVGIADRAYPSDVGQSVIRMDGILRRNAKTSIGESVNIRKAEVKEAKSITVAPAQEGVMIQADPEIFHKKINGNTFPTLFLPWVEQEQSNGRQYRSYASKYLESGVFNGREFLQRVITSGNYNSKCLKRALQEERRGKGCSYSQFSGCSEEYIEELDGVLRVLSSNL